MPNRAKSVVARMIRMTALLVGVVLLFGAFSPVSADTIRSSAGSVGSSASVGTTASDETVSNFIPLTSAVSGS